MDTLQRKMESKCLWFVLLYLITRGEGNVIDPCVNYTQMSIAGSRNPNCNASSIPLNSLLCDMYLPTGWYATENATLLKGAPQFGSCGVDTALWLKDDFPTLGEGTVNRTMCAKVGHDECSEDLIIQIKNCSTFFVYYLKNLKGYFICPAAYCFESSEPCTPPPTTTKTTTTQSKPVVTTTTARLDEYKTTSPGPLVTPPERESSPVLTIVLAVSAVVIVMLVVAILVLVFKKNSSRPGIICPHGTMSPPPPYENVEIKLQPLK